MIYFVKKPHISCDKNRHLTQEEKTRIVIASKKLGLKLYGQVSQKIGETENRFSHMMDGSIHISPETYAKLEKVLDFNNPLLVKWLGH